MKSKKSNKKGCLFLILGTVCVILGLLIYIFFTGRLTGITVQGTHGEKIAYAVLPLSYPTIVVVFVLLEAVLFLKFIPNEDDYKKKSILSNGQIEERKKRIPTKIKINIAVGCILVAVLIAAVLSANTYTVISEDGITQHFFADTTHYDWDRVSSYKIDCDDSKGLSITFIMDDGKVFEVLQNPTSSTSVFTKKYETPLAFMVDIDEQLRAMSVPRNVAHMETAVAFYKNDFPSLWKYVSKLTGYSEIYPDGDELPIEKTSEVSEMTSVS